MRLYANVPDSIFNCNTQKGCSRPPTLVTYFGLGRPHSELEFQLDCRFFKSTRPGMIMRFETRSKSFPRCRAKHGLKLMKTAG